MAAEDNENHLPFAIRHKQAVGFTLIEAITVLAILLVVASGAFFMLRGQLVGNLDADAEAILSRLQEAQSRAAAGLDNQDWGMRFEAPTSSPHFYVMFSGSYATSSATTTFYLSRFVEFEDPSSGTAKEAVFLKLTGAPSTSTVVVIRLRSAPDQKRTIDISRLGLLAIREAIGPMPSASPPPAYACAGSDYGTGASGAVLTQKDFRWFANANSVTPGAALAAENASTTASLGEILRLRLNLGVSNQALTIAGWTTVRSDLPTQGSGASMTEAADGMIYIIPGGGTTAFLRYDPSTETLSSLASNPSYVMGAGASLAAVGTSSIYVFPGNGNAVFQRYNVGANNWTTLAAPPGSVSGGGSLTYPGSGDFIYAFRGGNTRGFWRYSISGNSWTVMSPETLQGSGASMTEAADGMIYIIPGGGTTAFLRYDPSTETLSSLASNLSYPMGAGASLAAVGTSSIYVFPGNGNAVFQRYNVGANNWTTLAAPPGSVSGGGSLTYPGSGDFIYAFRGGNTRGFWRYSISGNSWTVMSPETLQGSGASMTEAADGMIYIIPGGGTTAFLRYDPSTETLSSLASNLSYLMGAGASLAAVGTSSIYVFPGNGNAVFQRYNVGANNWTTLAAPPGSVSGGGSLTYPGSGDFIYAFRGGNTRGFWRYSISGNSWTVMSPETLQGSGASMTEAADGMIYIIPGGGTTAFLRYDPSTETLSSLASNLSYLMGAGASLAAVGTSSIYVFPGNGNAVFQRYNVGANNWTTLAAPPGSVSGGGSLTYPGSGDFIYAFRGGNTRGFWRYSISGNSWTVMSPETLQGSGASMTEAADGMIYIIPGGGTTAFLRYDPSTETLSSLASNPIYVMDAGASLAAVGTSSIYVFPGNGNAVFQRYNVGANNWTTLAAPPGSVSGGGSLTYPGSGDFIYAFRGGNTRGFWRYSISGNSWTVMSPETLQGSGASMTEAADGMIYIIPGGGTTAFLRYDPSTETLSSLASNLSYPMGAGASLAAVGTSSIYVFPGNGNAVFQRYNVGANNWTTLAAPPGSVSGGGSLTYPGSGDFIYAFRGGGTNAFWRYRISDNTWNPGGAPSVAPATVNGGGALVAAGTSTLYAFRGNNTTAFWKYDIAIDSWDSTSLAPAPLAVRSGGSLSFDGSNTIYAFRGANTQTFWSYSISGNSWSTLADAPFAVGAASDSDARGGMVFRQSDSRLYAIPGNGYDSFMRYDPGTTSWQVGGRQLPGTGFVFGGGALISAGTSTLFAFRGNGSTDFWRYDINSPFWNPSTSTSTPWITRASAPLAVRAGGSLSFDGSNTIYAFRGANTQTFWSYSISGNSWSTLADAPFAVGAASDSDARGGMVFRQSDSRLYAIPGNGYDSFMRYDPGTTSWQVGGRQLPGTGFVFGGGALISAGTSTLFAFRGNGSTDFWRYDINSSFWNPSTSTPWITRASAPLAVRAGGSLSFDGSNTIYAFRGANTQTFWSYSISGNSWSTLADAPFAVGAASDTDARGGMVFRQSDSRLYAIPGNGYDSFMRYDPGTTSWQVGGRQLPGTGFVFGGGALISAGTSTLFAFRGNGSTDFWRYDINSSFWNPSTSTPWITRASAPLAVRAGGSLSFDGSNTIYAFRGANTQTFWSYSISGNSWSTLADAPFAIGAASDTDARGGMVFRQSDSRLYAIPGNGYDSFMRYDPGTTSWQVGGRQLPGTGFVFGGGALISAGTSTLFAFRGNGSTDFWRYDINSPFWNPSTSTSTPWITRASAPLAVRAGGSLSFDGSNTIYAFRGANTQTFWSYSISGNSWSTLADAPFAVGAASDSDARGGMVFRQSDSRLYAIPGNGYDSFMRYDPGTTSWQVGGRQLPGTGFVFGGGALISAGTSTLFAFRGNGSTDFWRYDINSSFWNPSTSTPWITRASAPLAVRAGGSLSFDGSNTIYAFRGANTQTFWSYSISGNSWSTLADAPFAVGAASDSDARGGMVYHPSFTSIFAIPGNGTVLLRYGLGESPLFKLQYATAIAGPWTDVGATSSSAIWRFYDNATTTGSALRSSGKTYTKSPTESGSYPDTGNAQLTNGLIREELYAGTEATVGWQNVNPTITIDLGSSQNISRTRGYFGGGGAGGIIAPATVAILLSTDNVTYTGIATTTGISNVEQWIEQTFATTSARYVRWQITRGGEWTMIGELEAYGESEEPLPSGRAITSLLLGSSTVRETYQEENPSAPIPNAIPVSGVGEWDWVLQNNGASAGTAYCFRIVKSDGTDLKANGGGYDRFPGLMAQ